MAVIGDRLILGLAGPIGLAQLIASRLTDLHATKAVTKERGYPSGPKAGVGWPVTAPHAYLRFGPLSPIRCEPMACQLDSLPEALW